MACTISARKPEADIFRHDFYFFHVGESFVREELDDLLHEHFRR